MSPPSGRMSPPSLGGRMSPPLICLALGRRSDVATLGGRMLPPSGRMSPPLICLALGTYFFKYFKKIVKSWFEALTSKFHFFACKNDLRI
jgi:hypothetical protein